MLLKYRIPGRGSAELPAHHLPLMDAQRALGLLRSRAKEWNLDPAKLGIIGLSAGGHLAAMASNHHESGLTTRSTITTASPVGPISASSYIRPT